LKGRGHRVTPFVFWGAGSSTGGRGLVSRFDLLPAFSTPRAKDLRWGAPGEGARGYTGAGLH